MEQYIDIIVVTHNSDGYIQVCLQHIDNQNYPVRRVVIVDSGSSDTTYLDALSFSGSLEIIKSKNVGYGKGNNLGFFKNTYDGNEIVLFINPDTFLEPEFCRKLLKISEKHPEFSVFTGKLLGFEFSKSRPTGKIDSTGIFRKWFGRWFDRGQGVEDCGQFDKPSEVPAACGALLCCRASVLLQLGEHIFDPEFFLYKEDIELSLRLTAHGRRIYYNPELRAYHCRGWQNDRQKIPHSLRMIAAENEVKMYKKHPSPYIVWALFKLLLVRWFKV